MTLNKSLIGSSRDFKSELSKVLSESVEEAQWREANTFTSVAGPVESRIVLFGAGGLGLRTLIGLRKVGIEPCAFSDNNRKLWGTQIEGVSVLSPEDAVGRFKDSAVFVVSIWGADSPHRYAHSVNQLADLGCEFIVPISWLSWKYSKQLLPHYMLDLPSKVVAQSKSVFECFELFADDRSRAEFVSQIQWRLTGDPGCLAHPEPGEQYLVTDISSFIPSEIVVDCGAYDGDTLHSWLKERGPFGAYVALEPDPSSRARLEASLKQLPPEVSNRVRVLPYAVSDRTGTVTFSATGLPSASVVAADGVVIDSIALDDLQSEFSDQAPTFLKMDIEGAELDAFKGGARFIQTFKPMMAIAAYHRQDHLWQIPLAVTNIWPEYKCYIRPHNEEGWDLIFYAVPPDRSRADSR